jgi:hypothetical protein
MFRPSADSPAIHTQCIGNKHVMKQTFLSSLLAGEWKKAQTVMIPDRKRRF